MNIWTKCPCGKRLASRPGGLCHRCYRYQPKPGDKMCRHCSKRKVGRPRGLCWICYYTPVVSAMYPSKSRYGGRGLGNGQCDSPLPAEATDAPPGSLAKMQVMRQRLLRGESLFHPLDNREIDRDLLHPFPHEGNGRQWDAPTGLGDDIGVATLPLGEAA